MMHLPLLAAGAVLFGLSATASAQEPSYLCTGISEDDRMEAEATMDYSLKLVYAQPAGNFLGEVNTRVADSGGSVLLDTTCDGPWLLIDLPTGSYEVTSTFSGESKSETISVTEGSALERTITF